MCLPLWKRLNNYKLTRRASREDMAAAATSPTQMAGSQAGGQMQMGGDQHITLMEDPDVWRPT